MAQGAQAETFLGLAGVGDLVLTCTGDLSRNRRVGLLLAKGQSLADILATLGHVAEGVACCPAVVARAQALGVDLPISAPCWPSSKAASRPARLWRPCWRGSLGRSRGKAAGLFPRLPGATPGSGPMSRSAVMDCIERPSMKISPWKGCWPDEAADTA